MKKVIFINTERGGYSPEQCKKTMTAAELIILLKELDGDTPVYLKNDGGYTYGSIREQAIEEHEEWDEE